MRNKDDEIYVALYQIRTLFNTMARFSDELHQGSGVSASERAILEALIGNPQTVPDVARARNVTRQHVQTIVNQLLEKGLVENLNNPAHKRSVLVTPTQKGRSLFVAIRKAEQLEIRKISKSISRKDLETTTKVLSVLQSTFQDLLEGKKDGQ